MFDPQPARSWDAQYSRFDFAKPAEAADEKSKGLRPVPDRLQ